MSDQAHNLGLKTADSRETKPARVLIVEDDPALRFAMCGVLRVHGFDVVEADSLEDATSKLEPSIAVVIADLRLPDGDGLALLPRARAIDPKIVVLIVTGFGTVDLAVRALKNGAENFLTKPVDPTELLSQVRHAIELQARSRSAVRGDSVADLRSGAPADPSTDEPDKGPYGVEPRTTSEVKLRAISPVGEPARELTLKDVEREAIRRALVAENGRVEAAARRLGVPRSTLYQKVKVYGLHVPRARASDKRDKS